MTRTRLQTYISKEFDERIDLYAQKLGMKKGEFVKYALTTVMVSIDQTSAVLENCTKEMIEKNNK